MTEFFRRWISWLNANPRVIEELAAQGEWLRGMRRYRQILSKDLARRMGVSASRVTVLEQDELRGAVTLRVMQKAARAMDCEFVYMLVPRDSLHRRDVEKSSLKPRIRLNESNGERV